MSKVGYGKPPVEHRFQRGHPKVGGRKAKPKLQAGEPDHVLDQMVDVTVDGRHRSVRAAEAVLLKQMQLGLEGDTSAARLVLKLDAERPVTSPATEPPRAIPQITFTTFGESTLKTLGLLTRGGSDGSAAGLITTWAARQALLNLDSAAWDAPDSAKMAFDIADPMAVTDLVPLHIREEWIANSQRSGQGKHMPRMDRA
jgi:hypothetical protein